MGSHEVHHRSSASRWYASRHQEQYRQPHSATELEESGSGGFQTMRCVTQKRIHNRSKCQYKTQNYCCADKHQKFSNTVIICGPGKDVSNKTRTKTKIDKTT